MNKTNIRKFSRNVYEFLDKLPLAVVNMRKKEVIFVVISAEEAEKHGISTKGLIQSE
jgi:hypothetical protein